MAGNVSEVAAIRVRGAWAMSGIVATRGRDNPQIRA